MSNQNCWKLLANNNTNHRNQLHIPISKSIHPDIKIFRPKSRRNESTCRFDPDAGITWSKRRSYRRRDASTNAVTVKLNEKRRLLTPEESASAATHGVEVFFNFFPEHPTQDGLGIMVRLFYGLLCIFQSLQIQLYSVLYCLRFQHLRD